MERTRYEEIDKDIIEEYLFEGKLVVYVNNFLTYDAFEEACEKVKFENNKKTMKNTYDAGNGVKFLWNKGCQNFIVLQFPHENPIYISSEKLMNFVEDVFYPEYCEDRFEEDND